MQQDYLLNDKGSKKRQIDCITETLAHLEQMKLLLPADKQEEMQTYITTITDIRERLIKNRLASFKIVRFRDKLNTIRKKIKLNFSYRKFEELLESKTNDT